MGDTAKGNDATARLKAVELSLQESIAGIDFTANGLVLRRQAFNGIGNTTVFEFQAIISRNGFGCCGEATFVEGFIEQDTRIVTGKRSPNGGTGRAW